MKHMLFIFNYFTQWGNVMSNQVSRCKNCDRVQKRFEAKYCESCGEDQFVNLELNDDGTVPLSRKEQATEIWSETEITMFMSTLFENPNLKIEKVIGVVFGTSSKMALGLNKQSTRLEMATNSAMLDAQAKAKLLGATAIVGLTVSLNSSQGANAIGGGSSDGVLVFGTAVVAKNI